MGLYGDEYFINNKLSIFESSLNDEINNFNIMMETNNFITKNNIINKIRVIWNKFKQWIKEIWNKIYNTRTFILKAKNKALKSAKYINNINEYNKSLSLSIKVIGFENKKAKYISNISNFGNFIFSFINMNDNLLESIYRTLDGYSNSLIERLNQSINDINTNLLDNKDLFSKDDSYFEDNIKDFHDISEDNIKGLNILKYIISVNIRYKSDINSNNIYYLGDLQLDDINNYYKLFNYTEELEKYHRKLIDLDQSISKALNMGENVLNKTTNSSNDKIINFHIEIIKTCIKELSTISNIILYLINIFTSTIIYNYNACYIINLKK